MAIINNSVKLLIVIMGSVLISGCSAVGKSKNAALQVTSNPQASIFINDKHLGKTPYFSDQLTEGTYTIKITAGEADYLEKIELKNGALTVINRNLNNNSLAQGGEILWLEDGDKDFFLASLPSGADIIIDGQYKGKTPALIKDIKIGEHKVEVTKNGYLSREFSIKTSNSYKLIANVSLGLESAKNTEQPLTNTKKVEILSTPQGFLRVRKEPQLSSQEVGQVQSGNRYEVIQEIKDWTKINFDGKLGWITSQYTRVSDQ